MQQQGEPLLALFSDLWAAMGHWPTPRQGDVQRRRLLSLLAAAASNLTAGGGGDAAVVVETLLQALGGAPAGAASMGGAEMAWTPGPAHGGSGGGGDPPQPSGPAQISLLGLLLATALIGVNGAVSLWLRLGLHSKLGVAVVRCIVQLSILGYVLVPIFVANAWWLTGLYSLFMLAVAAIEAVSRPAQSYQGMLPQVLVALGLASSLVISYGLAVVVQVRPWWDAQYLIPMLGMLLGNACSGVAVGLSTVLDELTTGKAPGTSAQAWRDKIEQLLALGATRLEATREAVQRATRMALMPLLNTMSVVGIVSIPGMMTGQILGGSDPATAARYQIIIMFLIAATTAISAVGTIFAAVLTVMDGCHRLRSERLTASGGATKGAVAWVGAQIGTGWRATRARAARAAARVRLAFGRVARQRPRRGSAGEAGTGVAGQPQRQQDHEREGLLAAGLREVVVGGAVRSRSSGPEGAAVPSPRQPLLGAEVGRMASSPTTPR